MNKITNIIFVCSLVILVLIGYNNRVSNYDQIPFKGESTDEYSNAWVGMSLISIGYPVGISGLSSGYLENDYRYLNVDRIQNGVALGRPSSINSPWFDHPPFTGIVVGLFANLKGSQVFEDALASIIRKPLVYLSLVTAISLLLLAYFLSGPLTTVILAAIYAFSPLIVVSSRMVQSENFLIPLFILSTLSIYLFQKNQKVSFLFLAAIFAGLGFLFKLSAVGLVFSGLLLLFSNKEFSLLSKIKQAIFFFLVSFSMIGFFLVFGLSIDWPTFISVFMGNSSRTYGIGLSAIKEVITTSKITNSKYLTDGWYFAGWLSTLMISIKAVKGYKYVLIPVVSYLTTYIFFGSHPFGWYSFPFLPFIYLGSALFLSHSLKKTSLSPLSVLILLMIIGVNLNKIDPSTSNISLVNLWRLSILFLFPLSVIIKGLKLKKVNTALVLILIVLALLTSLNFLNSININTWYQVT